MKPLSLGGDGRNDSPGHSAKYCSYTLLDLKHNTELALLAVLNGKSKKKILFYS